MSRIASLLALSTLCFASRSDAAATADTAPAAATPTILITGSNRGLGLEFARRYAERGWRVIATARDPAQAPELLAIAAKHPNVAIEALNVADDAAIAALAEKYHGQPIDVLLNSAGIVGDRDKQLLGKLDYAVYEQSIRVNSYAPLAMSQAFLDNVLAGEQKKIVAITSALASITNTTHYGSLYFYRIGKAGLNIGMRALQADVRAKGIKVGIFAANTVEARLARQSSNDDDAAPPPSNVAALIKAIDNLSDQEARFMLYNGEVLPW